MFICGNDAAVRAKAARGIEPLCILWCIPGFRQNDWTHAFAMLRA